MTLTRAQVVAYLERLSTTELSALIDELQRRVGMRPLAVAPPVAMGTALPVLMGVAPKTEFSVVLQSYGADKIAVIKALRELSPIGIKEAKDRVESAPVALLEDVPRDEAQAFAERLRRAGAQVDVR